MMDGWPRNAWYVAMYGHDLGAGQLVARTILGEGIALFRDAAGQACALEDACPHRNAPLSAGRVLDGGRVMCGYHGLQFDAAGTCVRNPHGTGRIPAAATVRSYPVREQFGVIWVWMGDRPADPTTLFDLSAFTPASGYVVGKPDWLLMEAPCDLIVDNLLDLSHVSFLHDGVLGNAETIPAQTTLKQDGDAITVERFMAGVAPPEYFNLLYRGDDRPVDMWHAIRWESAASLFLDVGCTTAGASRVARRGHGGFRGASSDAADRDHDDVPLPRRAVQPAGARRSRQRANPGQAGRVAASGVRRSGRADDPRPARRHQRAGRKDEDGGA